MSVIAAAAALLLAIQADSQPAAQAAAQPQARTAPVYLIPDHTALYAKPQMFGAPTEGAASGSPVTAATAIPVGIGATRARILVTRFDEGLVVRNQDIEQCGDVNIGSVVADRVIGRSEANAVVINSNFFNTGRCER